MKNIWLEMCAAYLEQVADAARATERLALLERILLVRAERIDNESRDVYHALDSIRTSRGRTAIDCLMAELGIGARQLERKFHQQVGLTPSRMCQNARIQHALQLMHSQVKPNWSGIAFECGFYDQAHFIRHFKSVTGLSPNSYLAEATLKLSET